MQKWLCSQVTSVAYMYTCVCARVSHSPLQKLETKAVVLAVLRHPNPPKVPIGDNSRGSSSSRRQRSRPPGSQRGSRRTGQSSASDWRAKRAVNGGRVLHVHTYPDGAMAYDVEIVRPRYVKEHGGHFTAPSSCRVAYLLFIVAVDLLHTMWARTGSLGIHLGKNLGHGRLLVREITAHSPADIEGFILPGDIVKAIQRRVCPCTPGSHSATELLTHTILHSTEHKWHDNEQSSRRDQA